MMNGLRYEAWQTEFFVILGHFLHFYPTNNPKNQNFENLKKSLDIIIFHKCTKNYDYMLHCSWDMLCDRWNSNFSFWAIFCPFTSNSPKNKLFLKKEKDTWRYYHLSQTMIICYTVIEIWCMTELIVIFHFGQLFAFLTLTVQKIKIFLKITKMAGDIITLHMFTKNYQQSIAV